MASILLVSGIGVANLTAASNHSDTWTQFTGYAALGNTDSRPKHNSTSAWFKPTNGWGTERNYNIGLRYSSGAVPYKGDLRTYYNAYSRLGKYVPNLILESNGYKSTLVNLHFRNSYTGWGIGGAWSPDSV